MPQFIDLEEFEQEKLGDLLEAKAIQLGMDKWENRGGQRHDSAKDLMGICYNCVSMRYCRSEFGTVNSFCHTFKMVLHGQDRITECNEYNERGRMSLRDMETIATLIDAEDGEIKGFISKDPKLMSKKKGD